MGLKALVLAVMESERGENARKLWQTEGLTVEYTVRETAWKIWTQLRQTVKKKVIFLNECRLFRICVSKAAIL